MGTGKSKIICDTIGMLYERKEINAALILAPKGVFDNWVKAEIPTHLPDRIERNVLRWTPSKTKVFQEKLRAITYEDSEDLKIFVMNIEAFSSARGTKAAQTFKQ